MYSGEIAHSGDNQILPTSVRGILFFSMGP